MDENWFGVGSCTRHFWWAQTSEWSNGTMFLACSFALKNLWVVVTWANWAVTVDGDSRRRVGRQQMAIGEPSRWAAVVLLFIAYNTPRCICTVHNRQEFIDPRRQDQKRNIKYIFPLFFSLAVHRIYMANVSSHTYAELSCLERDGSITGAAAVPTNHLHNGTTVSESACVDVTLACGHHLHFLIPFLLLCSLIFF